MRVGGHAVGAGLVIMVISACSVSGGVERPASSVPAATAAPSSPAPPTTASPSADPTVSGSVTLDCDSLIGTASGHQSGTETVLDVVQLPSSTATRALQTSRSDGSPTRYYAKRALIIRPGSAIRLRVVRPAALRATMGWGSASSAGPVVAVPRCPAVRGDRWLVYAGGYETAKPGCLELQVESGSVTRRVYVGVGAPCPGQKPPAQPSDG